MSETTFDRSDWRPSKKRASYVRVRSWGGAKQAPIALLAVAKASGFASSKAKRCSHCGKQPAMKGTHLCRLHGGASITARTLRPYVKGRKWIERLIDPDSQGKIRCPTGRKPGRPKHNLMQPQRPSEKTSS